ncbi:PREDICTED: conserved oligomeric Golgi complex subunit 3 [Nicrophorus vespilloides]|uniref:Conserved oligomeric Golgi complex subunit 3 n=1 Tax=Nicrophorus vespilloides TaxID=110193 RepID=A0ABM1MJ17_NICVS|nr:PREDICTED: conserved oligomeric Golgi complex subunit 3 [Nicrophorus vespilloides]
MFTMEKILRALNLSEEIDIQLETNDEIDRKVQENLAQWQAVESPLAPLSNEELELIYKMRETLQKEYFTPTDNEETEDLKLNRVDNFNDYIQRMVAMEKEIEDENLYEYINQRDYLHVQAKECEVLRNETENLVLGLENLQETYRQVSLKTDSLHNMSEQLMKHQTELKEKKREIHDKLKHFTYYHSISEYISLHSYNINSKEFISQLEQMNESMEYLSKNAQFRESNNYKFRYENLLATCLQNVLKNVNTIITDATNQVINLDLKSNIMVVEKAGKEPMVETAFSYYYGKFQNAATKISRVINYIEDNVEDHDMYLRTLNDIQKSYFSQRAPVMQSAVSKALLDLRDKYKSDHSILFRSAGLFLVKVCQDEAGCYNYFFNNRSQQLSDYLSTLCQNLYDVLRPCLIGINHIEVLTELCTILKEMLNDQTQNNPALDQFVEIINQLLQDVEERLVFRTNIFFQYDLNAYEPSPGDLAYPEKLEQMENIAEELIERRADSRSSSISLESQEVANINAGAVGHFRSFTGNSPADLHGMWYPTVKRTLVCLSRLYICLDREIFQGVAQEALLICVKTIEKAADKISARKSAMDAKLFQIKHLLIIREQIAPFQVDFTVKEMSLDFSHLRGAAMDLMHNRSKIFSLNNNAILEFLLEGTPRVKEYLVDSRKEIDKHLKGSCEVFISNTTNTLIGNLLQWLQKAEHALKMSKTYKQNVIPLREQEFTKPQVLAGIISSTQRNIKTKIPEIQRSMRLYLANRETEFILFRPIKNNIVNAFIELDQLLVAAKYTADDELLIACPTPEQLNILICSVSLTADQDQHAKMQEKLKE